MSIPGGMILRHIALALQLVGAIALALELVGANHATNEWRRNACHRAAPRTPVMDSDPVTALSPFLSFSLSLFLSFFLLQDVCRVFNI